MALSLLAFWLQCSPFLRACPFVKGLTAWKLAPAKLFPPLGLGLLLVGLVALPALAHASPPDPSWIPGIYDDADFDDVVTRAKAAAGDVAPALPADVEANPSLVGSVPRLVQTEPHGSAPSAVRSRAPPSS